MSGTSGQLSRSVVLSLVCAVVIALVLGSACSNPKDKIIGKWQDPKNPSQGTMEFFKDGTVSVTMPKDMQFIYGQQVVGKYTWVSDTSIKMELSGWLAMGGPQLFEVNVSGNELTLKGAGGPQTLQKV